MLIGYARVSTADQNLNLQKDALVAAQCEVIYDNVASGTNAERPGVKKALAYEVRWGTLMLINCEYRSSQGAMRAPLVFYFSLHWADCHVVAGGFG